jgi:hypothetical protein
MTFRRGRSKTRSLAIGVVLLIAAALAGAAPASAATADIRVHFTNDSDSVLTRAGGTLDHGCWSEEPPLTIQVGQTLDIASESCGLATGTEFHVSYTLADGSTMSMHYANPFVDKDTFEETAPAGYAFAASGTIEDRTTHFGCDSSTCDGIPDDWKKNGVTIDPGAGNPPQFVDLPKMGVSLDRPTILVELEWMKDDAHDQSLRQTAIDRVIKAFDEDPVTYHGATRSGITLVVDAGEDSTITPGGAKWGSLSRAHKIPWTQALLTGSRAAGYQFTNFYTLLRDRFVPTGRLPIFHYAVAADELVAGDSTSGVTPGDKLGFMVSLGDWDGGVGSEDQQTGTFMHEFGHTLGLDHSGGEGNADSVNWKPNYPSIMNYANQTKGVFRGGVKVWDYSRAATPDIDETTLTEKDGIALGANPLGYGTSHSCLDGAGNRSVFVQKDLKPVDFSCDGTTPNGGTGFDANASGMQTTLKGAKSDWDRIRFKTGGVGQGADAKDTVTIPSTGESGPVDELTYEQSQQVRLLPLDAKLTYDGATSGDYHDATTVSATMVDPGGGDAPVAGRTIAFDLGGSLTDACSAVTDANGHVSCSITPTQNPGAATVDASFAGDAMYKAASDSATFTTTKEETSLSLTGQTLILAGAGDASLSARLVEDGANDTDGDGGSAATDPAGQTVTFTVGGQSCSGTTDASGAVSCKLSSVSGAALGPKTLAASFAGDDHYRGSSASGQVIVFAFPARGVFTLGDTTVRLATPATTVSWWSDSWWLLDGLSGGTAPLSFKGFAGSASTLPTKSPANSCGSSLMTAPGNSPPPTGGVPSYMGVVVASSVTKAGSNLTGTWGKIVVVKTNPGYSPSPGHPGTGTIVGTFCG